MIGQATGLARALHLDQAAPWPDQVDELAPLGLLKARAGIDAVGAKAREQLVEEGLGLGALTAVEQAPLAREVDEASLNVLAGQDVAALDGEAEAVVGHRVVRALRERPVQLSELLLAGPQRRHDVLGRSGLLQRLRGLPGARSRV